MKNVVIDLFNLEAKIRGSITQDDYYALSVVLSYKVKDAERTAAYQTGRWSGRVRLLESYTFPSGLLTNAVKKLRSLGYTVSINDLRVVPKKSVNFGWYYPHPLRKYQKEAHDAFIKATRGTLVLPTASGKTVVVAKIIHTLQVPTLYLVQTQEAKASAIEDFSTCLGYSADQMEQIGDFTVSTIQAFSNKRSKKFSALDKDHYKFVVFDEVHHYGADTFFAVVKKLNAYYRLGITATFMRGDGATLRLAAGTGRVIYEQKPSSLVEAGVLARPIIHWLEYKHSTISPYADGKSAYLYGIVENAHRNEKALDVIESLFRQNKSVLSVVEKLEHGETILAGLLKRGIPCEFIHGGKKNRKVLQQRFKDGTLRVAIATRIYDESVNLPFLNAIVNLAGGKSDIRTLQRIGRALRKPDNSKEFAEYYDFKDLGHRTLEDHYESRKDILEKVYGKEKDQVIDPA
jgi:superfamily II DNA or RNA helicase